MPKSGDAATFIPQDKAGAMEFLAGNPASFRRRRLPPYDAGVVEFLHALSRELLRTPESRIFPDVASFAFWCRKANLRTLADAVGGGALRRGLGVVFHVTPSNVPINFAFSYAFGLLAGNSNIVRVSSRDFPQTALVCGAISRFLDEDDWTMIREMTLVARYPHDDAINRYLSNSCDGRIVWGGDATVAYFRSFPMRPRAVDVSFGDRYSLCVIDALELSRRGDADLVRLSESFCNDAYLMDQNACSSPHMVLWLGAPDKTREARERFWPAVRDAALRKYELGAELAVEKLTRMHADAIELTPPPAFEKYGNILYTAALDRLPSPVSGLRGKGGYFYEHRIAELDALTEILDEKCQTVTYFGIKREAFIQLAGRHELRGPDRIVPVGRALDISVVWDGYDLIGSLSRIMAIE